MFNDDEKWREKAVERHVAFRYAAAPPRKQTRLTSRFGRDGDRECRHDSARREQIQLPPSIVLRAIDSASLSRWNTVGTCHVRAFKWRN